MPRPTSAWLPLLFAVLTVALGWPVLDLSLALDDRAVIAENVFVREGDWARILLSAYWDGKAAGGPDYYRPLSLLGFALEFRLSGGSVEALHAAHLATAAALAAAIAWLLLTWLPERPWVAGAATGLWLAHPLHAEVLANLKSRDELYAALFGALALGLAHCGLRAPRPALLWSAGASFLLALLSKESALTGLGVVVLAAWVFSEAKPREIAWQALRPFGIALWLYVCLRYQATGTLLPDHPPSIDIAENNPLFAAEGFGERWGSTLWLFGRSVSMLLWPHPLLSDYSIGPLPLVGLGDFRAWGSGVLVAAMGAFLAFAATRERGGPVQRAAFCLAFALVTWSPASNTLSPVRGAPLADRYLFLPSLGLALGVAFALDGLRRRGSVRAGLACTGLVVLCLLGVWSQRARYPDWRSTDALVAADLPKAPGNPRLVAHFLKGLERRAGEEPDAARDLYREAVTGLEDTRAVIAHDPARYRWTALRMERGLASLCLRIGDATCARHHAEAATRAEPDDFHAWFLLGESNFRLQRYSDASDAYRQAWARKRDGPPRPDMQHVVDYPLNLCLAAYHAQQWERARKACREALALEPEHPRARRVLAEIAARKTP